MKLIIFAGGGGTRLWPLSRQEMPKQFNKIFSGKSTMQLSVERVSESFGIENIFIQTLKKYKKIIEDQIPELPDSNIIIEPEKRDVGPAVCFGMLELKKRGFSGPTAVLWADHLIKKPGEFIKALRIGEGLILKNPNRIIFLAEKSRFPNNNLGWIKIGKKIGEIDGKDYYEFIGFKYRPSLEECRVWHESEIYFWNPGYWITSIDFLLDQYKNLSPEIYKNIISGNYCNIVKTHFDNAIAEKINPGNAIVILTDMGWSDPGTLYALKEVMAKNKMDNVIKGKVASLDMADCLVYNLEDEKLVTTIGLTGTVIVNTRDALIVVAKDDVVKITKLLEIIREQGLESYL